jgi:hypothetical protein
VLLAAAAWGSLFVLLVGAVSAQEPDPSIPSGDPCCGHPDTWGEVAWGGGVTLVYAAVDGALFAVAGALVWWAIRGRWPGRKGLLLVPVGELLLAGAAFSVALVVDVA